MKRFNRPFTLPLLIAVPVIAFIALVIMTVNDVSQTACVAVLVMFVLLYLVIFIADRIAVGNNKSISDDKASEIKSVNTDDRRFRRLVVICILVTVAIIAIPAVIATYNKVLAFIVVAVIFLAFPVAIFIRKHTVYTVERYIDSKKKEVRPRLNELNDFIIRTVPQVKPVISNEGLRPSYQYIISPESPIIPSLISFRVMAGQKKICIYTDNPQFASAYPELMSRYSNNTINEIYFKIDEPVDYELVKQIMLFNIKFYTGWSDEMLAHKVLADEALKNKSSEDK